MKELNEFEAYNTPEFRHPKIKGSFILEELGILTELRKLKIVGETDETQNEKSEQDNTKQSEPYCLEGLNVDIPKSRELARQKLFNLALEILNDNSKDKINRYITPDQLESYIQPEISRIYNIQGIKKIMEHIKELLKNYANKQSKMDTSKILFASSRSMKPSSSHQYYYKRWLWIYFTIASMNNKISYSEIMRIFNKDQYNNEAVDLEKKYSDEALDVILAVKQRIINNSTQTIKKTQPSTFYQTTSKQQVSQQVANGLNTEQTSQNLQHQNSNMLQNTTLLFNSTQNNQSDFPTQPSKNTTLSDTFMIKVISYPSNTQRNITDQNTTMRTTYSNMSQSSQNLKTRTTFFQTEKNSNRKQSPFKLSQTKNQLQLESSFSEIDFKNDSLSPSIIQKAYSPQHSVFKTQNEKEVQKQASFLNPLQITSQFFNFKKQFSLEKTSQELDNQTEETKDQNNNKTLLPIIRKQTHFLDQSPKDLKEREKSTPHQSSELLTKQKSIITSTSRSFCKARSQERGNLQSIQESISKVIIATAKQTENKDIIILPKLKEQLNLTTDKELEILLKQNLAMQKEYDSLVYENFIYARELKQHKKMDANHPQNNSIEDSRARLQNIKKKIGKISEKLNENSSQSLRISKIINICYRNKIINEETLNIFNSQLSNLTKMENYERDLSKEIQDKNTNMVRMNHECLKILNERIHNHESIILQIKNSIQQKSKINNMMEKADKVIKNEDENHSLHNKLEMLSFKDKQTKLGSIQKKLNSKIQILQKEINQIESAIYPNKFDDTFYESNQYKQFLEKLDKKNKLSFLILSQNEEISELKLQLQSSINSINMLKKALGESKKQTTFKKSETQDWNNNNNNDENVKEIPLEDRSIYELKKLKESFSEQLQIDVKQNRLYQSSMLLCLLSLNSSYKKSSIKKNYGSGSIKLPSYFNFEELQRDLLEKDKYIKQYLSPEQYDQYVLGKLNVLDV